MMNATDPSQQSPQSSSSAYSYVDDYFPPEENKTDEPTMTATVAAPAASDRDNEMPQTPKSTLSQSLEDQNIFFLLGVTEATEKEQETFLDELQQVIWEDFLDRDMELLLTTDEFAKAKAILNKEGVEDLEKQEELIQYLEKLIPDLEDIMLEKALELKEEMFKERLLSLGSFYAGNQPRLDTLKQAEDLMKQGKWADAAQILNDLPIAD